LERPKVNCGSDVRKIWTPLGRKGRSIPFVYHEKGADLT